MPEAPQSSIPRDVEIQRRYYSNTASRYDVLHAGEGAADSFCQGFLQSILQLVAANSVLDVGTATGRGLQDLQNAPPGTFICGIEPVRRFCSKVALPAKLQASRLFKVAETLCHFPMNLSTRSASLPHSIMCPIPTESLAKCFASRGELS